MNNFIPFNVASTTMKCMSVLQGRRPNQAMLALALCLASQLGKAQDANSALMPANEAPFFFAFTPDGYLHIGTDGLGRWQVNDYSNTLEHNEAIRANIGAGRGIEELVYWRKQYGDTPYHSSWSVVKLLRMIYGIEPSDLDALILNTDPQAFGTQGERLELSEFQQRRLVDARRPFYEAKMKEIKVLRRVRFLQSYTLADDGFKYDFTRGGFMLSPWSKAPVVPRSGGSRFEPSTFLRMQEDRAEALHEHAKRLRQARSHVYCILDYEGDLMTRDYQELALQSTQALLSVELTRLRCFLLYPPGPETRQGPGFKSHALMDYFDPKDWTMREVFTTNFAGMEAVTKLATDAATKAVALPAMNDPMMDLKKRVEALLAEIRASKGTLLDTDFLKQQVLLPDTGRWASEAFQKEFLKSWSTARLSPQNYATPPGSAEFGELARRLQVDIAVENVVELKSGPFFGVSWKNLVSKLREGVTLYRVTGSYAAPPPMINLGGQASTTNTTVIGVFVHTDSGWKLIPSRLLLDAGMVLNKLDRTRGQAY